MDRAAPPDDAGTVSVDLDAWPDLTIVLLGMKITRLRGIATLLGLGPAIRTFETEKPDGLLHQDLFLWRLDHVGIRQYWRDFDSLERFTKAAPHKNWWADFSRDRRGTAIWHETYRRAGGMEAVYLGMPNPPGFGTFAPTIRRAGPHATARRRLSLTGSA